MNIKKNAALAFAKNRAEELGFDLWSEFVVPLYFDKLALDEVRKPIVFEGGRGCGKTTLLRYLSHATQLSERRHLRTEDLPRQIGLYLRADTQYLRTFRGDALSDADWEKAFEHELCLTIASEIFDALRLLTVTPERQLAFPGVKTLNLGVWQDFDPTAPTGFEAAMSYLRSARNKFAMWLNNPDSETRPRFFPVKPFLTELVASLRAQLPFLADRVFFVFIDEYENLLEYQMRVINTRLKHSEAPLIFHIATKRNGMLTRETVGTERLQERDDFRTFDVEDESAEDFPLFAAELFCFRLRRKGISVGPEIIDEHLLCSTENLSRRRSDDAYRRQTLAAARFVLPGFNNIEAAQYVMNDATLRSSLKRNIEAALRDSDASLSADSFVRDDAPIESICSPALIYQGKPPKLVLDEMEKAVQGKRSKFKEGDWSHHYFSGCMYLLFLPLQRPCILYAGFDSFLKMSRGNARHFLELCHLSILGSENHSDQMDPIPVERQAGAARAASAMFVKETQGSGDHGNRLFHVVNTLGQIFKLSQARRSQSETERTHFSASQAGLDIESNVILSECVKWSVLFVVPETKVKDTRVEANDYIFNPIYSPFFGISFNKGRKLDLKSDTLKAMLTGNREEINQLVKDYRKAWDIGDQDQIPLFGVGPQ